MVARPVITPADHKRLASEIRKAENRTSAEIYVVVSHSADDFRLVPFLYGAVVSLVVPWILWFTTRSGFGTMLSLQVLAFVVISGVLELPSVRYRIVPAGLAHHATRRAAMAQFMAHGVHLDPARTAILLYVSMLPRHIEVVADDTILAKLAAHHWQQLVDIIANDARSGRLADGLAAAIRAAGDLLAPEFPAVHARHHSGAGIVET